MSMSKFSLAKKPSFHSLLLKGGGEGGGVCVWPTRAYFFVSETAYGGKGRILFLAKPLTLQIFPPYLTV